MPYRSNVSLDRFTIKMVIKRIFYIKWSRLAKMSKIRTFEQLIVQILDNFTTEQKLEREDGRLSEIRTCSDFGRLLYIYLYNGLA